MKQVISQLALVACFAAATSAAAVNLRSEDKGLPKDFVWGYATAAYQVEGGAQQDGRTPSVWDTFSKTPGKTNNGDTGDVSVDFYNRMDSDIALLASYGTKAYRFSISWNRIIPGGFKDTPVNEKGVAFYDKLINLLLSYGITPYVTMYHWDLPQVLQDTYGGLTNYDQFPEDFNYYADVLFERFGDRVKYWMTFNEPWTFCQLGYGHGAHAPGRCSDRSKCPEGNTAIEPWRCGHSVLLAHGLVAQNYRENYRASQGGLLSMALNMDWSEPLTDSPEDKAAAIRANEFWMSWFADPVFLGDYPESMKKQLGSRLPTFTDEQKELVYKSSDYFAFNHYASNYAYDPKTPPSELDMAGNVILTPKDKDGNLIGPQAESPWLHVVPWGFRKALNWLSKRYNYPEIFVTENGCSVPRENQLTLAEALNDQFRVDYYRGYLNAMKSAYLEDGVRMRGYFGWSFVDNFEWADGYSTRFGVTYVNYTTQERFPKASAKFIADFFLKQS